MNEKLQSVLNKILQLTEQNSEFGVELRRKLGITSSVKATSYPSDFDKRVEHIEKYLGLDYYVDGQPSLIDYSFVKETEIRAQLISDNREMMRHRYGTRFHIINFDEYCRYAHLQVEMLLNYYYDRVDNTLDEIKKHIVKYNSTAEIANAKSLGAISYNSKLWAFCAEHNVGYSVRTILITSEKLGIVQVIDLLKQNRSQFQMHRRDLKRCHCQSTKKTDMYSHTS